LRDLFPMASADIALGRPGALGEEMDPSAIPGIPENRVAYVDGYGNLKTTVEYGPPGIEPGTAVRVRIGKEELAATVSDGSFGVGEGELAFAPGSSGWRETQDEKRVWKELFLRGSSAWEEFGRPPLGSEIEVEGGA
jgi:S-adenosylmethionine hydrolase